MIEIGIWLLDIRISIIVLLEIIWREHNRKSVQNYSVWTSILQEVQVLIFNKLRNFQRRKIWSQHICCNFYRVGGEVNTLLLLKMVLYFYLPATYFIWGQITTFKASPKRWWIILSSCHLVSFLLLWRKMMPALLIKVYCRSI